MSKFKLKIINFHDLFDTPLAERLEKRRQKSPYGDIVKRVEKPAPATGPRRIRVRRTKE